LIGFCEDGACVHDEIDSSGFFGRAGDGEVVAGEVVAAFEVVDDALVAAELLCVWEVGVAEVGFAALEVFDGGGCVAEDLGCEYWLWG
jgi:hypothetical protein